MAQATADAVEMPGVNRCSSVATTSTTARHQLEPREPTGRPELARTRVVPQDAVLERPAVQEPGQQKASASPAVAEAPALPPA
jgi:hypothetical protein